MRPDRGGQFVGGEATDLALDIKDCIDALDRCERQRRDDRQLPAHLCRDIGQHEELAPAVRPTRSLRDRPRFAASLVEPVEAGIGIGLKDSSVSFEMALEELEAAAAEDEVAAERAAASPEETTAVRGFSRKKPSRKPFPAHLPRQSTSPFR